VSGTPGFSYSFNFPSGGRIRTELYIDSGDQVANKTAFDRLAGQRAAVEAEFGAPLIWERLDKTQASRIAHYGSGSITDPPEKLIEYRRWAVEHLLRFRKVFGPRLRSGSPHGELGDGAL
jgi:hypothetical protein